MKSSEQRRQLAPMVQEMVVLADLPFLCLSQPGCLCGTWLGITIRVQRKSVEWDKDCGYGISG